MAKRLPSISDRYERDDKVRRTQAEALLRDGLARAADVEGSGDDLRPTLKMNIPVEIVGDGETAAFVAADRLIVPNTRINDAVALARETLDASDEQIVRKAIGNTDYGELRTAFQRFPDALRDRLTSDEFMGRRNHLLFSASYHYRVREGDDPERSDLPQEGHAPDIGRHATVAILDTGLARQAVGDPWLGDIAAMLADVDVDLLRISGDVSDPLDFGAGHGTFVAGIVRQLAPAARVEIIRVLDSNGAGLETEIARGFDRAVQLEPDVILCAFGGYSIGDRPPAALEAAIALVPKDVLIIAAAGNERQGKRPIWPATLRGVEAIAAIESGDDGTVQLEKGNASLAWYSNTGPHVRYAASGTWTSSFVTGQESADRETDGNPDWFDASAVAGGTSFAAAAVVGAVAAALREDETAVEAWDRVRQHTMMIDNSDILALDAWSLTEAV